MAMIQDTQKRKSLAAFILRVGRLPALSRIAALLGAGWGVIEVADRFGLFNAPKTTLGFALFILSATSAALAIELFVLGISRYDNPPERVPDASPERAFAQSVVSYAQALGSSKRDDSVIELRHWATRFLHLGAMFNERIALGEIALKSAMAKTDRLTQTSILIDDLGWTVYESGDKEKALANIEEAIEVLDRELSESPVQEKEQIEILRVKALRHKANINAANAADLVTARKAFETPRRLAAALVGPQREFHLAQLDHSESQVIGHWIGLYLGSDGRIDPSSTNFQLLQEAIELASSAEFAFRRVGDKEREIKALKLLCELHKRETRRQPALEAAERLERLQMYVARNIARNQQVNF